MSTVAKICGVTYSSVAKRNGIAVASISKIDGITASSYQSESVTLFAAMTAAGSTPSDARKLVIDTAIAGM